MSKKDDKRRARAREKRRAGAGKEAHNQPGYKSPLVIAREAQEAERKLIAKRRAERTCGECRLCCTFMGVQDGEVAVDPNTTWAEAEASKWKPAWRACQHECEAGCAIYKAPERPKICGAYSCLWREGWGEDHERPDLIEVLPEAAESPAYERIGSGAITTGQVLVFRAEMSMRFGAVKHHRERFVKGGGVVVQITPHTQTIFGPLVPRGLTFSTQEIAEMHDEAVRRRGERNGTTT